MTDRSPQSNMLSDDDLDLLSAYLDDRLSPDERLHLEQRLRLEQQLRVELDELRITRELLQDLAPVALPRSFTINSASVQTRQFWSFGWFARFGGALSSLVLVVLVSAALLNLSFGTQSSDSQIAIAPTTVIGAEQPELVREPEAVAQDAEPPVAASVPETAMADAELEEAVAEESAAEEPQPVRHATLTAPSGGATLSEEPRAPTAAEGLESGAQADGEAPPSVNMEASEDANGVGAATTDSTVVMTPARAPTQASQLRAAETDATQSGTSAVGWVIGVAVIAILALAVWVIWQRRTAR